MQLQSPLATVTPTVDGQVLSILTGANAWFTVRQITNMIENRSAEGVRKTLRRLVEQGVVLHQPAGRSGLYRLNRDHLAASSIIELSDLRSTFFAQLRAHLDTWEIAPHYAAVFGSAARGTMNISSDIDIFLIRDIGLDPHDPLSIETLDPSLEDRWDSQLFDLSQTVYQWTGNYADTLMLDLEEVRALRGPIAVLEVIASEGITVFGDQFDYSRLIKNIRGKHESISQSDP